MTQPLILDIKSDAPAGDILMQAAQVLNNDGVVAAPTETRYGLLVRHDSHRAMERLINLKRRNPEIPMALFVRSIKEMNEIGAMNKISEKLARRFLPGPLTLVLDARIDFGAPLVVNGKIGMRYSSSAVIDSLLKRIKFFPTATSANLSGRDQPATVKEIVAIFGNEIDLYLDAGPLPGDVSTVVDCSEEKCRVLRQGTIGEKDIFSCLETA